jgi:hypothetical protein
MKNMNRSIFLFVVCWGVKAQSDDQLELCRQKLEALIRQFQTPLFFPVPRLIPNSASWLKSARGLSEALAFSERYKGVSEKSPDTFLYSNALESCKAFSVKFESQIHKWLIWEVSSVVAAVCVVGILFYLYRREIIQ